MREIENAERFFREADSLVAYANSHKEVIALLYDIQRLPDELETGTRQWLEMLIIIDHWRAMAEECEEKKP